MLNITVNDIVKAVNGTLLCGDGTQIIEHISIDSRSSQGNDIFVPIIPAIVASGFLMGIMEALNFMVNNGFIEMNTTSSIYVFAKLFSNVAYTVSFSALTSGSVSTFEFFCSAFGAAGSSSL